MCNALDRFSEYLNNQYYDCDVTVNELNKSDALPLMKNMLNYPNPQNSLYKFNWAEKTGNVLLAPLTYAVHVLKSDTVCPTGKLFAGLLGVVGLVLAAVGMIFKKLGEKANPKSPYREQMRVAIDDLRTAINQRLELAEKVLEAGSGGAPGAVGNSTASSQVGAAVSIGAAAAAALVNARHDDLITKYRTALTLQDVLRD